MLFTGERADVEALLPGLDVFAMASRYEGLPCAIVEAMGAGLPVVATAVNSVPNVVIAGETGLLVPPGRPELLGRAIGYLIDNPAEAARLGAAGRERLGAELAPDALGAVLREAYRGAVPTLQPPDPNWPCHDGAPGAVLPHRDHAGSTAGGGAGAGQRLGDDGRRVVRVRARVRGVGGHRIPSPSARAPRPSRWPCTALGLPPGAPVLTPTLTFCGAVQAIVHAGLRPVLVDTDEATLTVSAEGVAKAARNGAAAMVIQHMAGYPVDSAELAAAAGIPEGNVVEDAAHGLGATVGGRPVGSFGRAGCFSFYATKNLPIGEGGAITTTDGGPGRALAADAAARDERRFVAALPPGQAPGGTRSKTPG